MYTYITKKVAMTITSELTTENNNVNENRMNKQHPISWSKPNY